MKGTIVLAGSLAQRPGIGGHTWVFLQYLLGFRRLGWEVLFLDRLEPEMCRDATGESCGLDDSINLRYFLDVMEQFGFGHSYALLYDEGRRVIGLSRQQLRDRVADAACLINVMGFITDHDILSRSQCRVFLDIDPGFGQMWLDLGLHNTFANHDAVVTIGENVGHPDCVIPTCGLDWITTPQPVVLEVWPQTEPSDPAFTTIATWRGAFGPIDYQGKTYGLRVHEFRKYASLPRRSGLPFTLALDIHPSEVKDLAMLEANRWTVMNPATVASTPAAYQQFIQRSAAEFMVAKSMYVDTGSGWLSDRTLCYLASGRPVVVQDTGLTSLYPTGNGLLTFSDLEEALQRVAEVRRNYAHHQAAARALAEEYFDSDIVLNRLLHRLGIA